MSISTTVHHLSCGYSDLAARVGDPALELRCAGARLPFARQLDRLAKRGGIGRSLLDRFQERLEVDVVH